MSTSLERLPLHSRMIPLLSLAAALCAGAAGCGAECALCEVRCDGKAAQACVTDDAPPHWASVDDCGDGVCVIAPAAGTRPAWPFCALSGQPDARCVEADLPSCAGEVLVSCRSGYATEVQPCSAGCVTLDGQADRCGEDQAPDPACATPDGDLCLGFASSDPSRMVEGRAPSATCLDGDELVVSPAISVYAARCASGRLVSRTRCDTACVSSADCTTHCR